MNTEGRDGRWWQWRRDEETVINGKGWRIQGELWSDGERGKRRRSVE